MAVAFHIGNNPSIQDTESIHEASSSSHPISIKASENGVEETSDFSTNQRILILLCICLTNVAAALAVHIYYPSLPMLEKDLHTSTTAVNASVSVYKLIQALWPPFLASISDVIGRRLIYLLAGPLAIGSCVGLALAPTITCLIGLRVCQALSMAPLYSVGFGVISDITHASNRPLYISIYYTVFRVFTLLGPVIGGAILYNLSWRFNFWFLLCITVVVFSIITLLFPETLPALLVDHRNKYLTPIQHIISSCKHWYTSTSKHHHVDDKRPIQKQQDNNKESKRKLSFKDFTIAFQNLTKVHVVMNLLLSGLYNAIQDCYNITTAQLLTERFGLNSQMVGLCYLPQSIAGIIGGLFAGVYLRYWFNKAVHRYNNEKTNGTATSQEEEEEEKQDKKDNTLLVINDKSKNLPYDFPTCKSRLVPVWINGILVQVITALYGWCYVWHAPLPVLLCLQFLVGINIPIVDSAISTLTMDFRPKQAASAIASSNLFNQGFGAIASLVIYPIIQAVGVGYAFTIASLLLIVIGNLLMILLLKYGSTWREACDKNEK